MHWARRAASRADCTAGSSKAIRTAMMAITTRSSIRVNPRTAVASWQISEWEKRVRGMVSMSQRAGDGRPAPGGLSYFAFLVLGCFWYFSRYIWP